MRLTYASGGTRRVVHAVYESDEFNALLRRLPRAISCAHVPAQTDLTRELSRLEAAAHEQLG